MFPWRQFGRETLWGRRGLVKIGSLWLPLAVLLTLDRACLTAPGWSVPLALFVAAACRRIAGTLANDLADRADDRTAGKTRWSATLTPGVGGALTAALAGMGLGALVVAGAPPRALAAYLAATLLSLGYSVRPLRAKERGALGLVVFAISCVLMYVVTPWLWFGMGWRISVLLGLAVFLDKWVNLHFHQVVDWAADAACRKQTYVVSMGVNRGRRILRRVAGLAATSMVALLLALTLELPAVTGRPMAFVAGVTVAAAWGYTRRARCSRLTTPLVRELPWPYLGLSYATFRPTPLVLLGHVALRDPAMVGVWGLSAGLFVLEAVYTVRYRYE